MIKSFADKSTKDLFVSRQSTRLPSDLRQRAIRKLDFLERATCVDDLAAPSGNRFHALKGDREGQCSISINVQWRICFRFHKGNAYDVEITDYH